MFVLREESGLTATVLWTRDCQRGISGFVPSGLFSLHVVLYWVWKSHLLF